MSNQNIQELDDEQLINLYETTKKLLDENMRRDQNNQNSANRKISNLKQKLDSLEEELKGRSLWEDHWSPSPCLFPIFNKQFTIEKEAGCQGSCCREHKPSCAQAAESICKKNRLSGVLGKPINQITDKNIRTVVVSTDDYLPPLRFCSPTKLRAEPA